MLAEPRSSRSELFAGNCNRREHAGSLLRVEHDASANRVALSATLHCLTGCAIGEILGLAIGTALGWGNAPTIVLAIALAFLFGYAFTFVPLVRRGIAAARRGRQSRLRLTRSPSPSWRSSTTPSILVIPGAMEAGLDTALFWGSLALALAVAFVAAFPVNRWLIARGRGHAVAHAHH